MRRPFVRIAALVSGSGLVVAGALAVPGIAAAQGATAGRAGQVVVTAEAHHDTSPPLRGIRPSHTPPKAYPAKRGPVRHGSGKASDTSGRGSASPFVPSTSTNFDGIPADGVAPPDTDGAAGATQYVELVNSEFEVFNKSGGVLLAPRNTNTLWSGFGGGCETNNDGDGTISWDTLAGRWVIQQFSVSTTPYLECIAVSTSGDATGAWNRYSFTPSTNFPDYPKLGVWADGYYVSYNLFDSTGTVALGNNLCGYDRSAMLNGAPATQQCAQGVNSGVATALPATVDGATAPPTGSPEWFVGISPTTANALSVWKFHADWTTPANSAVTATADLPVAAFSQACGDGGTCIPQAGTAQQLDSLADRLMYRLAYRNFGDHEALVVNHSVTAGASVGVRWYELRPAAGALSLFQQGTYAPDATYRWMGSVAQDKSGDMALGFSTSSSSLHPGLAYTGRLVSDAAGTMPQGEQTIFTGAGSQTGQNLSRWGDYSAMTVDPADDCTFWYANEYEPANGAFNWHTRVGSFKFPSCGGTVTNDFSLSVSPASGSVTAGSPTTATVSTAVTSGSAQTVSLSATGLPSGASASFAPSAVTSGGSSTLTLSTAGTTPPGTYLVTITGTGASATHTTTYSLTVTAPVASGVANGGFESGNFSGWTTTGTASVVSSGAHSGTYAARAGATTPTNGDSTVAQTFTVPSGNNTLSFWYNLTCPDSLTYDWATATLKDNTTGTTTTPLAKTCVANSGWTQVNSPVSAGHSYTLTLTNHDDNYPADPTYTLFDDVTLSNVAAPAGIANGGFETGTFSGWTTSGASTSITTTSHSGSYAALAGSTTPTNGDSTIAQTFTAPAGTSHLGLYYANNCPDTVTYDWVVVTLRDNTAGTTTRVVGQTCAASYAWTNAGAAVTAGHSYTLTMTNHDDNYSADPTYTLFDDITLS